MLFCKYLLKGLLAVVAFVVIVFPIIAVACSFWFLLPLTLRHE